MLKQRFTDDYAVVVRFTGKSRLSVTLTNKHSGTVISWLLSFAGDEADIEEENILVSETVQAEAIQPVESEENDKGGKEDD